MHGWVKLLDNLKCWIGWAFSDSLMLWTSQGKNRFQCFRQISLVQSLSIPQICLRDVPTKHPHLRVSSGVDLSSFAFSWKPHVPYELSLAWLRVANIVLWALAWTRQQSDFLFMKFGPLDHFWGCAVWTSFWDDNLCGKVFSYPWIDSIAGVSTWLSLTRCQKDCLKTPMSQAFQLSMVWLLIWHLLVVSITMAGLGGGGNLESVPEKPFRSLNPGRPCRMCFTFFFIFFLPDFVNFAFVLGGGHKAFFPGFTTSLQVWGRCLQLSHYIHHLKSPEIKKLMKTLKTGLSHCIVFHTSVLSYLNPLVTDSTWCLSAEGLHFLKEREPDKRHQVKPEAWVQSQAFLEGTFVFVSQVVGRSSWFVCGKREITSGIADILALLTKIHEFYRDIHWCQDELRQEGRALLLTPDWFWVRQWVQRVASEAGPERQLPEGGWTWSGFQDVKSKGKLRNMADTTCRWGPMASRNKNSFPCRKPCTPAYRRGATVLGDSFSIKNECWNVDSCSKNNRDIHTHAGAWCWPFSNFFDRRRQVQAGLVLFWSALCSVSEISHNGLESFRRQM